MIYLPLIIFSTFLYKDKGYILHILVINTQFYNYILQILLNKSKTNCLK